MDDSRPRLPIAHIAIPCADLDEAVRFYGDVLGCRQARRYDDRVTFEFFGAQVVCHLSPDEVPAEPRMYPRHFGMTFLQSADYQEVLDRARVRGACFHTEPFMRFEGMREQHQSFFLVDPSNNLVEFKHYDDPEMAY